MHRSHAMPFGATRTAQGGAHFRLWAPAARQVEVLLPAQGTCHAMARQHGGWFELELAQASVGLRYLFRIDGALEVPDPASRHNPDDVHAASALTDPLAFDWPDAAWRGRPWEEAVLYELHVGCFTPAGTFLAAIERLDALVALGITAIELMPVADFPGRRGWGYDGVLLYAPEASYGTPDDLKRLVAAAHGCGLMVLLDVVYNHFGPDGNHLHAHNPAFFKSGVSTPWGAAINFDGEHSRTVRDFFIHNALYWLEEFHFDGLRIDAVHAMHDSSRLHFVDELAQAVRQGPGRTRAVHIVLENHHNDADRLARSSDGRPLLADAQWNDDLHHALHVLASGETDGYYSEFAAAPLQCFGQALAEGFVFQRQAPARARKAGSDTPSTPLTPLAFVNSLQTHDQVGNRAFGERLGQLAQEAGRVPALRALTACVLLAPAPPMLFMGEEHAATTPFLYFCDFQGELAQAVTRGRRSGFRHLARFATAAQRDPIPDPNDEHSFLRSKLAWQERTQPAQASTLALYTELLHCRARELVPWLKQAGSGHCTWPAPGSLRISWPLARGRRWHLLAQLADEVGPAELARALPGRTVYRSHDGLQTLPPWSVQVSLESP